MASKIRFLLTSKCSAKCGYCHNEGQDKQGPALLSLERITHILSTLQEDDRVPDEIILSGGEPTVHKNVAEIARLCKMTGAFVSMDSHAGHPNLLQPVLPYLDELKVHVDSFDEAKQFASMKIKINNVRTSIGMAQKLPLLLRINHPLKCPTDTVEFVTQARTLGVDCKIIDMFSKDEPAKPSRKVDWYQHGYINDRDGQWLHCNGRHRLFTKSCSAEHNLLDDTLFIGADGIRRAVDGVSIGRTENFSMRMVKRRP